MRIPLDYYRIIGVPIQSTSRQITQAYQDRRLQMPRREYSDLAITARQQLLDQAYTELSDPEKRSQYNTQFLKNYDIKTVDHENSAPEPSSSLSDPNPWLEISQDQFLGALLILQELGEYELVLRLGDSYLIEETNQKIEATNDAKTIRNDLILTIALGCLELGREQWQQREYENAVASGKAGQELLLREGLFPSIQGEIQADLYKLRPYRVLELLATHDQNITNRRKGIRLLQEMLQERGGIEGLGDDKSGLTIDDFLRFIQQLRSYLTVAEQQEIFEFEAKRPSAVATYLAVYALLARGFADKKPELILRAKKLLLILAKKQDVHLEQSICSLLLGQTEEAGQVLELSQEYESIAFIRENSLGDSDLLHGLCLYTERWLQNEVFLHFQDLINREVSLTEYFAAPQVQTYLEQLLGEENPESISRKTTPTPLNLPQTPIINPPKSSSDIVVQKPVNSATNQEEKRPANLARIQPNQLKKILIWLLSKLPSAAKSPRKKSRVKQENYPKRKTKKLLKNKPQIPLIVIPLVVIIAAFSLGYILFKNSNKSPEIVADMDSLAINLTKPPVPIPAPETEISLPSGQLDENTAKEIIQAWLDAKAKAFGKDYQIDSLKAILTDPILSVQLKRATSIKNSQAYFEYEHQVLIKKVEINQQKPEQGIIEADIVENAKYYQGEKLMENKSYNSNLVVSYDLILVNETWLIKDLKIIK